MSDRMDSIKRRLEERKEARKGAGGEWRRRGECKRCGACCDARNLNPESYKMKAAEVMAKTGRVLSSICGNHGALPEQGGQLGCKVHRVGHYPPGCASFPDSVEQHRLVMATCGYWFEWVDDTDRAVGKARRARA